MMLSTMSVSSAVRVAALLMWFVGVGFGAPCVVAIRNLLQGRDLPMIMGFRAYGGGPFERLGIQTTVALLAVFMAVCLLECVAGWLLWSGNRTGGILALGLLPVGALFWWGFALPIPPMLAVVRTILIIISWRTLR